MELSPSELIPSELIVKELTVSELDEPELLPELPPSICCSWVSSLRTSLRSDGLVLPVSGLPGGRVW
jgi:hypothetical protein